MRCRYGQERPARTSSSSASNSGSSGGDVLRQVDERLAADLGRVDERRHLDDRGERRGRVGDVGEVVRRQRSSGGAATRTRRPCSGPPAAAPARRRVRSGHRSAASVDGGGHDDVVEPGRAAVDRSCDVEHHRPRHLADLRAPAAPASILTPSAVSTSPKRVERCGRSRRAHVAEHLLLEAAAPGGVEPLDRRPDERRRRVAGRRRRAWPAAAGSQKRSNVRLPGPRRQPLVDRDLLHPLAVADLSGPAKMVAPRRRLVDEVEPGQAEELDGVRDRAQARRPVPRRSRVLVSHPAQLVLEPDGSAACARVSASESRVTW